ncbi:MAG: ribosome maturation factor RimP [Clostridia bacterium]|nr:ribosome maturation factor RimP [Clostridia bacterium]
MKVKPVADTIAFLQPIANEVGVEIVDAEWDMRTRSFTVYIDAEGGVDLNLCEKFHRAIDEPLDEFDPSFGESYTLNCSSPGLDRPFKTARDYEKHMGEKIEVRLYAPLDGKKYYEGVLLSYENGAFTIATDKGEKTFTVEKTAKVCLCIEI